MAILIGADQTVNNGTPGNYTPQIYFQPVVASASGTATTMSVRLFTTGGSVILGIADASRNILGQTAAFAATTGLNTQSLLSGVSIVSGTTYNLFVAFATEAYPVIATDGTTTSISEPYGANAGFTWPTLPSPFPAAVNNDHLGAMGIYASGGGGGTSISPSSGSAALAGQASYMNLGITPRTARQAWEYTNGLLVPIRKIFLPSRRLCTEG